MSRARSSCGSGGEAEERVDLTFGEQIHRPDGLTRDPADIPAGIEPDVGQHAAHEHVRAGTQGRHPDGLAFQIRDAPDAGVREQLEASCMHAGHDRDRVAGSDRNDQRRRKVQAEIHLAVGDLL